nr:NAD(P)/FAD-dependent oxidoreductase [Streptomyces paludis]
MTHLASVQPRAGVSAPARTMLGPDFPFSYDRWLRHPAGLGVLPDDRHGHEVAVVGAGIAGITAAYELMRLGLRPVVYEAAAIGGRMRSEPFPGYADHHAEMGAMRFPRSAASLAHYIGLVGLRTRPFPNPLAAATPSTVVDLGGISHRARTMSDLPPVFQEVEDAWNKTLLERAELSVMDDALRRREVETVKAVWNRLVPALDDQSFYGFLATSPFFSSFRHREIFGQVGFGTGGWDTDFPNSVLDVLRLIYTGANDDQEQIVGGCRQLPERLWTHPPADPAHWPHGTSLAALHKGGPRPAVTALARTAEGFLVQDAEGRERPYPAVVFTAPHRILVTKVAGARRLFSAADWTALERTHYMCASKLWVLVDRPFWYDRSPDTGRPLMGMTLTDRAPRSVYLLDDGPDRPAAMCLSYTWNDDSLKFSALDPGERLEIALSTLADIYPGVDIRSHIVSGPVSVSWENEPHFMGAFKANLPGHYRYQRRLFTHFMQDGTPPGRRGLFLAGDDVSWTGGFAEGAVTTALNAVWGTVRHLGGTTRPENPGPGDLFDRLAPVDLPG